MDTIFMNSENSKYLILADYYSNFLDKIILKEIDKYVALLNLGFYHRWKNIKKSYKNNRFKMSSPTWNEVHELPDGSYSVYHIFKITLNIS